MNQLLINDVTFENTNNKSKVTINIDNLSKETRVHVYTNQFQKRNPNSLKETLE